MTHLGTVLREARLRTGMEQRALAKMLGISTFTLNRVERGRQPFKEEWIDGLSPDLKRLMVEAASVYYREKADEIGRKLMRRKTTR